MEAFVAAGALEIADVLAVVLMRQVGQLNHQCINSFPTALPHCCQYLSGRV